MDIIKYPQRKDWGRLLQRPYVDNTAVLKTVHTILKDVKANGDSALRNFSKKFDGIELTELQVSQQEIDEAENRISDDLKTAINIAKTNIEAFHQKQITPVEAIQTMPGVQCWRKSLGIEKVGLYVPGGTAPLFSTVLMLAIPAKLAGCKDIVLCTPVSRDGSVHPAILYATRLCGVTKIFKVGGAQAIAAMAYGTETVPAVYKIFGPGNQYVTTAKQVVQMDPNFSIAHTFLAHAYQQKGMFDEAIREAQKAMELLEGSEHRLGNLGDAYARAGKKQEARNVLARLKEASRDHYISPYQTGLIYASLGQPDEALDWLERAYQDRFWMMAFLKVDPRWDSLRSHPRFNDLLRRTGLASKS